METNDALSTHSPTAGGPPRRPSRRPAPPSQNERASSSYDNWGAVYASLDDAQTNPPEHLEGEESSVYEWPDEPIAGAMVISNPEHSLDDKTRHATAVVLLLMVRDDGGVLGVCLNSPSDPPTTHLPVGLEDVPILVGGGSEPNFIVGLFPTPDGKDDTPQINMDGLSHVVGATDILQKVLRGQLDREKLRLYAGFRYWKPGCLEAEIKEGSWITVMATRNFVFKVPATSVYFHLLERLGFL